MRGVVARKNTQYLKYSPSMITQNDLDDYATLVLLQKPQKSLQKRTKFFSKAGCSDFRAFQRKPREGKGFASEPFFLQKDQWVPGTNAVFYSLFLPSKYFFLNLFFPHLGYVLSHVLIFIMFKIQKFESLNSSSWNLPVFWVLSIKNQSSTVCWFFHKCTKFIYMYFEVLFSQWTKVCYP